MLQTLEKAEKQPGLPYSNFPVRIILLKIHYQIQKQQSVIIKRYYDVDF
jgi:hypothetical protein